MVDLTRTVRFCVNPPAPPTPPDSHASTRARDLSNNTFAGAPSMRGLGRYYELEVRCRGEVDPATGYFINIKEIDRAVRASAVPIIERACAQNAAAEPASVLMEVLPAIDAALGGKGTGGKGGSGGVQSVRWRLTPYYSVEMPSTSPSGTAPIALLRQQFDFAAAHRLHAPGLSDADNRAVFGKCNNLKGHGHNYRVEPCVEVVVNGAGEGAAGEGGFTLIDLERIVAETILARFDHTHLNEDTPEFDQRLAGGLNPSVENIAKVFFDLLGPAIARAARGARLRSITVWETDKTSCTYPG